MTGVGRRVQTMATSAMKPTPVLLVAGNNPIGIGPIKSIRVNYNYTNLFHFQYFNVRNNLYLLIISKIYYLKFKVNYNIKNNIE